MGAQNRSPYHFIQTGDLLFLKEAIMSSDDYWEERYITWSSLVATFAICIFLFTAMFLVDAANYYLAETDHMDASPNIYVGYDVALDGED